MKGKNILSDRVRFLLSRVGRFNRIRKCIFKKYLIKYKTRPYQVLGDGLEYELYVCYVLFGIIRYNVIQYIIVEPWHDLKKTTAKWDSIIDNKVTL